MKKLLILTFILSLSFIQTQANPFDNLVGFDVLPHTKRIKQQHIKSYSNYSHQQSNPIIQAAKSHLGQPYKWGATGPYTFDCSGFTQTVFAQFNIYLPRISHEQAQVGQLVSRYQLRRGDLVFFSCKTGTTVRHVGIYLGNGKFIHASSAQHRVVISSINSRYYGSHFKWGRRL